MSTLALARGDDDPRTIAGNWGRDGAPTNQLIYIQEASGMVTTLEPMLIHPAFPEDEGLGLYTYPLRPHFRRGFDRMPVQRRETTVVDTVGSSVVVSALQGLENVTFEDVWLGSDGRASVFSEMVEVFKKFWHTSPGEGSAIGYLPRDVSTVRLNVAIVDVIVGSPEWEWAEVRRYANRLDDAVLDRQVTLRMRLLPTPARRTGSLTTSGR